MRGFLFSLPARLVPAERAGRLVRGQERKFKIKTGAVVQALKSNIMQVKIFKRVDGIFEFKIQLAKKMQLINKLVSSGGSVYQVQL